MQVSRSHDVWVPLPENEREAVEGFLRRKHIGRMQFVSLDAGGPGVQVSRDLAAAFRALSGGPALRERLGAAGQSRVGELSAWERRRERLLGLHSKPVGDRESDSAAAGAPR